MRLRWPMVLLGALACDPAASADRPTSSEALLRATFTALVADDRAAWDRHSLASAPDLALLCPSGGPMDMTAVELAANHRAGFDDCRVLAPWAKLQLSLLRGDDRRCGPVDGCPGLERLCKSELFAHQPDGAARAKIDASGVVRRTADGTLLFARAPRCFRRDL